MKESAKGLILHVYSLADMKFRSLSRRNIRQMSWRILANIAAPYHCQILHGKTKSSISNQTTYPANEALDMRSSLLFQQINEVKKCPMTIRTVEKKLYLPPFGRVEVMTSMLNSAAETFDDDESIKVARIKADNIISHLASNQPNHSQKSKLLKNQLAQNLAINDSESAGRLLYLIGSGKLDN
uniref:Uncharacterized protein n=1 Tax=Solanum lycopersicum TaxID=4081 RepID=A0A3Q7HV75_SOLLC